MKRHSKTAIRFNILNVFHAMSGHLGNQDKISIERKKMKKKWYYKWAKCGSHATSINYYYYQNCNVTVYLHEQTRNKVSFIIIYLRSK